MILHHSKEFSRHANTYDSNTFVQKEVARHLVSNINSMPKTILDLGCGSGEVYRNITWPIEHFCGIDSSHEMSALHPESANIKIINADFESPFIKNELNTHYDLIISSSALQWAKDIEAMIRFSSSHAKEVAFAIFTDKTFEDIYRLSGLQTFLPNASALIELCKNYFTCHYEIKQFKLYFEDNLSLFRYIKTTGVSGGKKQLSIAQTKALIHNYPHTYLEFEVLFVWGVPKKVKL